MTTHNNNVGAVIRDIGEVTFKTLREFEIPCDEILFGKQIIHKLGGNGTIYTNSQNVHNTVIHENVRKIIRSLRKGVSSLNLNLELIQNNLEELCTNDSQKNNIKSFLYRVIINQSKNKKLN